MWKLSRKDKTILAGGLFALVILIAIFVRLVENNQTQICLDNAAKNAAETRSLMNWASGKEKDVWDNTFILEKNNHSVQFLSKGADGKEGTKEDIHSKIFKKRLEIVIPARMEVRKSLWKKVKSKIWSD